MNEMVLYCCLGKWDHILLLLLTGDDRPECTACRCPLAVEHFLLECAELSEIRIKYFTATSMKDLFDNTNNQLIVDFIKDINFTIVYNIVYSILS